MAQQPQTPSSSSEDSQFKSFWLCLPDLVSNNRASIAFVQPQKEIASTPTSSYRYCTARVLGSNETFYCGVKAIKNILGDMPPSDEISAYETMRRSITDLPGAPVAWKIVGDETLYVQDHFDGDLIHYRKSFARIPSSPDEQTALALIIKGLLEQVSHVHSLGLCHRDIKPGNVGYQCNPFAISLIDFQSVGRLNSAAKHGGWTKAYAPRIKSFAETFTQEYDWACAARTACLVMGLGIEDTLTKSMESNLILYTALLSPTHAAAIRSAVAYMFDQSAKRFPGDKPTLLAKNLQPQGLSRILDMFGSCSLVKPLSGSQHPNVSLIAPIKFRETDGRAGKLVPWSRKRSREGSVLDSPNSQEMEPSPPAPPKKETPANKPKIDSSPAEKLYHALFSANVPAEMPSCAQVQIIRQRKNAFRRAKVPPLREFYDQLRLLHDGHYTLESFIKFDAKIRLKQKDAMDLFFAKGEATIPKSNVDIGPTATHPADRNPSGPVQDKKKQKDQ
eukprot:TRINITY_DN8630_c0_g1_i1.p1 TRINITY_DN8630_c0_g1~~TRINITY_DN8630_c0_g1_i1.p1  ORF type:complete len:540 (+),score=51.98 TRINITY_DN8630_c0_g1_i1:109-1620(+)